ncbi:basic proline-rich protein-like [Hyaena hyaena]|uniref:basic proline-rich protein-like n=1 Tax=Hyaena hyaena TaxID=95912 RepID=UPI0019217CDD|nr:basic proline-rich protein-like [Hyaena hyaena]
MAAAATRHLVAGPGPSHSFGAGARGPRPGPAAGVAAARPPVPPAPPRGLRTRRGGNDDGLATGLLPLFEPRTLPLFSRPRPGRPADPGPARLLPGQPPAHSPQGGRAGSDLGPRTRTQDLGSRTQTPTQDPGLRVPDRGPRLRTQDRGPRPGTPDLEPRTAGLETRPPRTRIADPGSGSPAPTPRPQPLAPPTLAPGPELRTLIPAKKPRPRPHIPIPDLGHRTADHSPDPGPSRSPQGPRPLPARDPTRAGQEDAAGRRSGGGEGGGGAAPAGGCGEGPGPGSPGRGRGCCAHLVLPDAPAPRRLSRLSRRSGGGRVRAAPRALWAGAPARLGPVPRRLLHSRARARSRSRSRSAAASVRPSDASSHRDGRGGPCPQPRETPRRVTAHVARARRARPRPRRAHARALPPCAHPGSVRERLKGAARAVGEPAAEGPQAWSAPGPALRRALCASVGLPAADPLASPPSGYAQPLLARDWIPASRWTGPVLGDARGGLCCRGSSSGSSWRRRICPSPWPTPAWTCVLGTEPRFLGCSAPNPKAPSGVAWGSGIKGTVSAPTSPAAFPVLAWVARSARRPPWVPTGLPPATCRKLGGRLPANPDLPQLPAMSRGNLGAHLGPGWEHSPEARKM